MTLDDLQHIFDPQLVEGTDDLYFMLTDRGHSTVLRHAAAELPTLLPLLDSFQYASSEGRIPRFVK